jgi:hypothetical protein
MLRQSRFDDLDDDQPESEWSLLSPFKRLAAIMIVQAIRDAEPRFPTGRASRDREWKSEYQQSALNWIFCAPEDKRIEPYTFSGCCLILDVSETAMRQNISRRLAAVRMQETPTMAARSTPLAYLAKMLQA